MITVKFTIIFKDGTTHTDIKEYNDIETACLVCAGAYTLAYKEYEERMRSIFTSIIPSE